MIYAEKHLSLLSRMGRDGLQLRFTGEFPEEILAHHRADCIRIPMAGESRSLNLANSVAIVLYEALRQNAFSHMKLEGSLTKFDDYIE